MERVLIVRQKPTFDIMLELAAARFCARWADFGLCFLCLRFLRRLGALDVPFSDWYGALILSVVANSVFLSTLGTTPWKAALGLRVLCKRNGGNPRLPRACAREFLVAALGMGCGVPLLALPAGLINGHRLVKGKRMWWSSWLGLATVGTPSLQLLHRGPSGKALAILLALGLMIEVSLICFVAGEPDAVWIIRGL